VWIAIVALASAISVFGGFSVEAARAVPDCNTGVITLIINPRLTTPAPVYSGSTVTSDGGSWQSCGIPFTGSWTRWLRNGVVVSGPTWVPGDPPFLNYVAQTEDINYALTSQVQPCNADGCYNNYVGSSNSLTPSNRAPATPTNLAPVGGTTADSTTPTLSATFSDPDGHSGYVAYTVRRNSDNVLVASGNGSTVGSGGTSTWTVTGGALVSGTVYTWSAQAIDVLGAGSAIANAGTYGANPVWSYPPCSTDGSAEAETSACDGPTLMDEGPSGAETCSGADGFCDATLDQLQAAGINTKAFTASQATEFAGNPDLLADGGLPPQQPNGFSGYLGWFLFFLVRDQGSTCAGQIVDHGYCGALWFSWVQFVNGEPVGPQRATRFFARSGNDNPADKWWADHGPVPDTWASSLPSGYGWHHVGWHNHHFQGYWRSNLPEFYPGQFSIDPFNIYSGPSRTGVHRNAFEIHGGWQGHEYEASPTHGCIRIRYQAIPVLRAKWQYKTDNRFTAPGPTLYHYYDP
jgi:hypothetical protein